MEEGPQDRFALKNSADGKRPILVFNHLKEIVCERSFDLNALHEKYPLRKDRWIDPHRLANACLLFSVAKDLRIRPGFFCDGDEKIGDTLQELLSSARLDVRLAAGIIKDWKYIVSHPVARSFVIREKPFMMAEFERGSTLGYFGSFELFVRCYLLGAIRALEGINKVDQEQPWILNSVNLIASNLRGRMFLDNPYHAMDACDFLLQGASFELEEIEALGPAWEALKAYKSKLQGTWWGQNRGFVEFEFSDLMSGSEDSEDEQEPPEVKMRNLRRIFFQMVKHRGYPNDLLCQENKTFQHYLSEVNQILLDPHHNNYLNQISARDEDSLSPHRLVSATQVLLYAYAYDHKIFCSRLLPQFSPGYVVFCEDPTSFLDEKVCETLKEYELFAIADSDHEVNSKIAQAWIKNKHQIVRLEHLIGGLSLRNSFHQERGEEDLKGSFMIGPRPLLFGAAAQAAFWIGRRGDRFQPTYQEMLRALEHRSGANRLTPEEFDIELLDVERIVEEEEARRRNASTCVIC